MGMPGTIGADDADAVPRQGVSAMSPSTTDRHARAKHRLASDLRLVDLLLAALAAACVIAALAGSVTH
jgi:hypothetical protein